MTRSLTNSIVSVMCMKKPKDYPKHKTRIHCFAEIYRQIDATVLIRFYWLRERGFNGRTEGWNQSVVLPIGKLLDFAERGGNGYAPATWNTLSVKETFSPKIVFVSTENLKKVVDNVILRRKLARFFRENFHYRFATEIRLFDDFVPYSFFFQEMIGDISGMCGGVILHDQDNLLEASYSIHT